MRISQNYHDGQHAGFDVHDTTAVNVRDHAGSSTGPYVCVEFRDDKERVLVFLPVELAEELGNALCQLPSLEEEA